MTSEQNAGRCTHCGATRQACAARSAWPRNCCPACLRAPQWATHGGTHGGTQSHVPAPAHLVA